MLSWCIFRNVFSVVCVVQLCSHRNSMCFHGVFWLQVARLDSSLSDKLIPASENELSDNGQVEIFHIKAPTASTSFGMAHSFLFMYKRCCFVNLSLLCCHDVYVHVLVTPLCRSALKLLFFCVCVKYASTTVTDHLYFSWCIFILSKTFIVTDPTPFYADLLSPCRLIIKF